MGRGRAPCCDKNNVKKGPWSPAEDLRLTAFIQKHGHGNWRSLPKQAGLSRCGKSCRLRWINYLSPNVKRGNFTLEEEEVIIKLHDSYGNKWSKIAAQLPGRTDNEIKNVWNTHLKKRLIQKDSKCHKDEKSKDASIISPSSSSSSATSNVSCGEQNTRNGINDQDFVAKMPEISTQICPDIKPKEASRSTSFSSNVSNASNFWGSSQVDITRPNEEMDSLFNSEGLGEVHNAANVGPLDHLEDINHGFLLDSEFDLWNVLENLESFEAPPEQSSKVGLKYDIKQSEWYRYLENYELGITGEQDQSNPQKKAGQTEIDGLTLEPEIDLGMSTCFPLWPPSPHNFDI